MRAQASARLAVLSVFAVAMPPMAAGRTVAVTDPPSPAFRVTQLATPGAASWAIPRALNGEGRVTGNTQSTGVIWDGVEPIELPALQGWTHASVHGINLDGSVVGAATDNAGASTAFFYDQGIIVDLLPQRSPGEHAMAVGINDAGLIAGSGTFWDAASGSLVEHAIVWQPGTAVATVIELPAFAGGSTALAVNNAGQVLGQSGNTVFTWHDGEITELGQLNMAMLGFNDSGAIAGYMINAEDGRWLAVVFAGGAFDVLDTLEGFDAQAWGLNNVGEVVGSAQIPSGEWHATLWTPDTAIDLHALVADQIDGTLTLARGINDAGQIIAQASGPETYASAWLLTPVALGDIDGDGVVGIMDVLQLLAVWGPCTCAADLDNDGVVTVSDLLLLLGNWG